MRFYAALLLATLLAACDKAAPQALQKGPAVPSVTLRFRPADGTQYREHWVYDLSMPGEGLRRDTLSFALRMDLARSSRTSSSAYGGSSSHSMD